MQAQIDRANALQTGCRTARKIAAMIMLINGLICGNAIADPVLWIGDGQNRLGTVDVSTGELSLVGSMGIDTMTDIAFDRDENLWGISFSRTYRIDKASGAATLVGVHGISGGNALVFGDDNTMYAAGFIAGGLFSINTNTGVASLVGTSPLLSNSADLAFFQGQMYMSDILDRLIKVDHVNPANSSLVGNLGFPNIWGIATADDGNLYGAGNTTIIQINPLTGAGTFIRDYGGGALGQAYGSAFISAAIPEPSAFALFIVGALALGARMLRVRSKGARNN